MFVAIGRRNTKSSSFAIACTAWIHSESRLRIWLTDIPPSKLILVSKVTRKVPSDSGMADSALQGALAVTKLVVFHLFTNWTGSVVVQLNSVMRISWKNGPV